MRPGCAPQQFRAAGEVSVRRKLSWRRGTRRSVVKKAVDHHRAGSSIVHCEDALVLSRTLHATELKRVFERRQRSNQLCRTNPASMLQVVLDIDFVLWGQILSLAPTEEGGFVQIANCHEIAPIEATESRYANPCGTRQFVLGDQLQSLGRQTDPKRGRRNKGGNSKRRTAEP